MQLERVRIVAVKNLSGEGCEIGFCLPMFEGPDDTSRIVSHEWIDLQQAGWEFWPGYVILFVSAKFAMTSALLGFSKPCENEVIRELRSIDPPYYEMFYYLSHQKYQEWRDGIVRGTSSIWESERGRHHATESPEGIREYVLEVQRRLCSEGDVEWGQLDVTLMQLEESRYASR